MMVKGGAMREDELTPMAGRGEDLGLVAALEEAKAEDEEDNKDEEEDIAYAFIKVPDLTLRQWLREVLFALLQATNNREFDFAL